METVTGFELHQNQWVYCSKQVRRTRLLDCSTFMNATYWWKSWKVLAARTESITGTVNGKCGRGLCIQTPLRAAMADLCTALCQPGFSGGFGCQSSSWSFCEEPLPFSTAFGMPELCLLALTAVVCAGLWVSSCSFDYRSKSVCRL